MRSETENAHMRAASVDIFGSCDAPAGAGVAGRNLNGDGVNGLKPDTPLLEGAALTPMTPCAVLL
jgi:hypothetical protein